ncbi:MAG: trehalose-6-phosphate synthase [Gammaproteobacteria bacterium]
MSESAARLVVISNRVAVPRAGRAAPGGLSVAVNSALEARGGLWFGWDGRVVAGRPKHLNHRYNGNVEYVTTALSSADHADYYLGFSNRVLWPLLHDRLVLVSYRRRYEEAYRRTNAWFADQLMSLLRPGDTLWVHDYHLVPIAAEVRARGFRGPIGFFLHTPFPSQNILRCLPIRRQFLEWLAAYDLLGFQTDLDQYALLDAVTRDIGARPDRKKGFRLGEHQTATGVFPVGVDVGEIVDQVRRGRNSRQVRALKESLSGRRLIVGADRLDYSKGLIERFYAYGHLLDTHPELHGDIVYLQVAEPSRSDVPEYQDMRHRLDQVAGEIIGNHARFDWMPIRYMSQHIRRPTLLAFFSAARVGLVTPLRDGMNLVAKEYVAAQNPEDPGVLVLSELAGAARQLKAALLVNPYDVESTGDAIAVALAMPLEERRRRWRELMRTVRKDDILNWSERFLKQLEDQVTVQGAMQR